MRTVFIGWRSWLHWLQVQPPTVIQPYLTHPLNSRSHVPGHPAFVISFWIRILLARSSFFHVVAMSEPVGDGLLDWACWSAAPHLPIGVFIPACSYVQLSSVKTIRTIITVFVVPTACNPRVIFLRIWPPHTIQSGIFDVLCFPQPWVSTHATKILYFPYGDSSGAEFACYSTICQWCGPPCYI